MVEKLLRLFIASTFMLAGCATEPEKKGESFSEAVKMEPEPEIKQTDEIGVNDTEIQSINPDLLYLLLASEVAGQKGDMNTALDGYLKAAEWSQDPRVAERATQTALFLKDEEKALQAADYWVKLEPENLGVLKILALLNLKSGKYEAAQEHLTVLLAIDDADIGNTLVDIIRHLDKSADKEQAIKLVKELAETHPDNPDIHYSYALLASGKKQYELAFMEIRRAIELKPDWPQAKVTYARIAAQSGNIELALDIMSSEVESQPDDDQMRMVYAQLLVKAEKYPLARAEFESLISNNPQNHDARYALAMLLLEEENDDAAREMLEGLVEVPKWQGQALFYLGRIDVKRKDLKNALEWFEKIPPGPLFMEAQFNAVTILTDLGESKKARVKLENLRSRFPDKAVKLYLLEAEVLTTSKDYQAAFDLLTQALEDQPGEHELLYTRALVAEHLGRVDVLETDLAEILRTKPDDVNALNALGYTLAEHNQRLDDAERYLEKAIALKPDMAVIQDSYGWLQFRLGNYPKALEFLRRAYDKNQDPEIAAHLGEVLWMTGAKQEAKLLWQKALKREPGSEFLMKIKKRFKEAF